MCPLAAQKETAFLPRTRIRPTPDDFLEMKMPPVLFAAALGLVACDSRKPSATPSPSPGETTLQRIGNDAKDAAIAAGQAAREAAEKAKPALQNAGEKTKELAGKAGESLKSAAESAREKIHEATAPASPTPTPDAAETVSPTAPPPSVTPIPPE